MDLELTDEQTWLERVADHAAGARVAAAETAHTATPRAARRGCGRALVEFGVAGDDELGAVELCLAARALGAHLASTPFLGSAALRYAGRARQATSASRSRCSSPAAAGRRARDRGRTGLTAKVPSSTPEVDRFAVVRRRRGRRWPRSQPGGRQPSLARRRLPLFAVTLRRRRADAVIEADVAARLTAIGALLAAAESVGAAEPDARRRARLRRRAPPVRPHDRQLPGAAPPPGRHVRAPGERLVDRALRRRRARRRPARRPADRGGRQGLRGPRRARGRARRAAGLRRHRLHRRSTRRTASCAASSSASSSSATPRTTSASSAARSRRAATGTARHDRDRLQRPDRPAPRAHHHRAPTRRSSARCSPTSCTTRAGSTATSR